MEIRSNHGEFGSLDISNYNSKTHKGVLVDNRDESSAIVTTFDINKADYDTSILTSETVQINASANGTII